LRASEVPVPRGLRRSIARPVLMLRDAATLGAQRGFGLCRLGAMAGLNRPDRDILSIVRPSNRDRVCLEHGLAALLNRRFSCDDLSGHGAPLGDLPEMIVGTLCLYRRGIQRLRGGWQMGTRQTREGSRLVAFACGAAVGVPKPPGPCLGIPGA
jgi:hypothetical protein